MIGRSSLIPVLVAGGTPSYLLSFADVSIVIACVIESIVIEFK